MEVNKLTLTSKLLIVLVRSSQLNGYTSCDGNTDLQAGYQDAKRKAQRDIWPIRVYQGESETSNRKCF